MSTQSSTSESNDTNVAVEIVEVDIKVIEGSLGEESEEAEEEEVDDTLQELEKDILGYFIDNKVVGWGLSDSMGDNTADHMRDGGVYFPQRRYLIPEAVQIQATEDLFRFLDDKTEDIQIELVEEIVREMPREAVNMFHTAKRLKIILCYL